MFRGSGFVTSAAVVLMAGCGSAGSVADHPASGSLTPSRPTAVSGPDEPTPASPSAAPSPDPTSHIGYLGMTAGGMAAIVVEPDGDRVAELPIGDDVIEWISLAPDGQRFAAAVGINQETGTGAAMRVQPRRGWESADIAGHHRAPSWSPDSRRIAFAADPIASWECRQGEDEPLPHQTLTIVDDVTGEVVQQLPVPRETHALSWSPNGRALAWSAQPGFQPCSGGTPDETELVVLEVDTGEVTRRSVSAVNAYRPVVWSPDGGSLVVRGDNAEGPLDLLLVASFDAESQPIRLAAAPGVPMAWTPHGIVMRVERPAQPDPETQLVAVDAESGAMTDLVTIDGEVEALVSLADNHLAVATTTLDFGGCDVTDPDAHCDTATANTALQVIDPSTGEINQIVEEGLYTHAGGLAAIDRP